MGNHDSTMGLNMGGPAKREPSADARRGAQAIHEMYVALVDDGMEEDVAIKILGQMLKNIEPEDDD
jgi:hypothetical protein